jgi:hypothetical protein
MDTITSPKESVQMSPKNTPSPCGSCKYFERKHCALFENPSDENRRLHLEQPCKPLVRIRHLARWTYSPDDAAQAAALKWIEWDPVGEPIDATIWVRLIRGYLMRDVKRVQARNAQREVASCSVGELRDKSPVFALHQDSEFALVLRALAKISAEDVVWIAIIVGDGEITKVEGVSPSIARRRAALAEWRLLVLYFAIDQEWSPASNASWCALKTRRLTAGVDSDKLAFEETERAFPGAVASVSAWKNELYVPAAERSLELLRVHVGERTLNAREGIWRAVLGLAPKQREDTDTTLRGGGPSGPRGAGSGENTTHVDHATMFALLEGELDDEATLAAFRALSAPGASDDRAVLMEMARGIDAVRAMDREQPFTFLLKRKVTELRAMLDVGGVLHALGVEMAGVARAEGFVEKSVEGSANHEPALGGGEVQTITVKVGQKWRLGYENSTRNSLWLLVGQRDEEGEYMAWGDSHGAVLLHPRERWWTPEMSESEAGVTEVVAVGIRRDPREVAAFEKMDEVTLREMDVIGFQRWVLVAEGEDGGGA